MRRRLTVQELRHNLFGLVEKNADKLILRSIFAEDEGVPVKEQKSKGRVFKQMYESVFDKNATRVMHPIYSRYSRESV